VTDLPRSPELSLSELPNRLELPALITNLTGFAALAGTLMVPSWRWATLWLWTLGLVTLAEAAWFSRADWVGFWRRANLADTFTMGRGLLAIAATIGVGRFTDDAAGLVGPLLLVLLIVVGEPIARRLGQLAVPYAAGLPGVRTYERAWVSAGTAAVVDWFALALLCFAAAGGAPASSIVVAAACAAVIMAACLVDSLVRIQARRSFQRRLPAILGAMRPTFVLHWSAPSESAYQVAMWLPYLERVGKPFFIVVRTSTGFEAVRRITNLPIVLRQSPTSLDALMVPSLKAALYVNSATINGHLVRFSHLTHIQLNHGDSEKGPSYSPVFRMFDKDFVAGRAAVDRFAANGVDVPPELFVIVGRPQVESIEPATRPIVEARSPVVLYAPTWSGFHGDADYSSLGVGEAIVAALLSRGCTVVFRPHPYSRRNPSNAAAIDRIIARLRQDAATTGRRHLWGAAAEKRMSINDCFNASDAMVADVSSVVNDYLYSLKPFAMVAVSEEAGVFDESFPVSRAGYVIDASGGSPRGLERTLDELLGQDPRAAVRRQLRTYYLGDFPRAGYAQHFVDALARFV
jgi:hypothetical protein